MRLVIWATLAVGVAALCVSSDARACGGCFAAPQPPNSSAPPPLVTSHRMALSISTEQTVLWDQIRYAGEPSEFAWVLPVKPGARIELASDAWFDVLDAATSPLVVPPEVECGESSSCSGQSTAMIPRGAANVAMGCGDAGADAAVLDLPDLDGVDVVSHGSAGPYEMVVLHGDEPGALQNWLADHDYAVEEDISPLIDSYVDDGFDFVALRLVPSAGVQQMRPVRVIQPGAVPVLPLRMVAAGSAEKTALSLFVITEGRYTPSNFPEGRVDPAGLVFSFDGETSNYSLLRDAVFASEGGRAWLSPFARAGGLFKTFASPSSGFPMLFRTSDGKSYTSIADAYVHQGFTNGETTSTDCAAMFSLGSDGRRVVNPCDESGDCRSIKTADEIDARAFACPPPIGSDLPFDDLAVALTGQHPSDVWLTRLDANLARSALDRDLELAPASMQSEKSAYITARVVTGLDGNCSIVDAALVTPRSKTGRNGGVRLGVGLTLAAAALAIVSRRLAKLFARLPSRKRAEVQS
jgi:hypothetical protein